MSICQQFLPLFQPNLLKCPVCLKLFSTSLFKNDQFVKPYATPVFSYPKSVYEEKQDQIIEAFRDYQSKNGIYQSIKHIHDDSQIKYEEWFGPDSSEKLTAKENFIYRAFGNEAVDSYRKL